MFCKYCGKPLLDNADICLKCGKFVDKAPVVTQPSVQPTKPSAPTSSMGSAYILAIISFVLSLIPIVSLGGFVTSIISLCQYKSREKKEGKGLAVAGLVISSLFLALIVLAIIFESAYYVY